jgi:iron(III) transport system permease protein
MLVEALHYFPLVLMTLIMTTSAYSQQAKEAARLGSSWWRLMIKVFLPLGMPGLAFGMSITFLKTMDDLATPLSLGVTNLLAPQAFLRVSAYGSQDPLSSLIATLMVLISGLAWLASIRLVRQHMTSRNGASATTLLSRRQMIVGFSLLGGVLMLYAILYAGVALTSIARVWSYTPLPESFVLSHYLTAINDERGSFINTLAYCGFAAVLDVLVGLLMAYAIDCASPAWKKWLTWGSAGLLSVPGVALAIAYLQFFRGIELPFFNQAIDATWFMLPMAFSVRGLPFAIRACTIALQGVPTSFVEAANLSGGSRFGVTTKIVLPMMAVGLFVAFLLCFGLAAVDLSSAMLLVPSETDAPVSYSIYLNMQSTTGRGAGSALAILSIALVALSLFALLVLIRPNWKTASSFRKFVFTGS